MKLSGVRVLDLSQFLPGPHLTMTMADHGADVIMVEPPGGEPSRQLGARTKDGVTVWFRNIARGKRSEIDYLNGLIVQRGAALGVATPVNRVLWALVKLLEGKRA